MPYVTGANGALPPTGIKHDTEHYTTDVAPLRRFMAEENLGHRELADMLGVSASTPSGWLKNGRMPKLAAMAIEGIKRRRRADNPATVYLVAPGKKAKELEMLLKAMDLEFIDISTLGR